MTDAEILKKAIEKAMANGYIQFSDREDEEKRLWLCKQWTGDFGNKVRNIVFDHDFAKAFWGTHTDPKESDRCGFNVFMGITNRRHDCPTSLDAWQFYLQQIVLETEPLKYIGKFI